MRTTLAHGSWQAWADELCARGADAQPVAPASVDLVVGSEVTYTEATYPALLELLFLLLRRGARSSGGLALIASKRFYYGVGGSVTGFLAAVHAFVPTVRLSGTIGTAEAARERLSATVVASVEDGATMIRDIVCVRIAHPTAA